MTVKAQDPPSFNKQHPLYASFTSVPLSPTATLITVAGQVAEDPETGETPSDLSAQVDLCLRRLKIILDHAGAGKADITRFMYYVAQGGVDQVEAAKGKGAAIKLVGGKVGEWLEGNRPASCFLRVFGMSDERFLCEFECMAVVTKGT
ncbi:hypothetical protein BU16DRAFT_620810 [Lophium mytilinum]|uniref:YjgF-like protein n=1 Tax=Lophium mytilinum TaxID=390894 RepID=A0A6A6QK09_9PEZI|nr:hypothetical protein BU16DRAFT_620810 [Lophium mytilinum]